jgi:hypothetical protein
MAVELNREPVVPPVVRHTNGALGPDDDLPAQQPNGSAPAAPASTAAKSAYPPPAPVPTQEGPRGIRFDFNLAGGVAVVSLLGRRCLRAADNRDLHRGRLLGVPWQTAARVWR